MILTVTPNPALDITVELAGLQRGRVQRAARSAKRAGGKGVNVARVLVEQGFDATSLLAVGGGIGQLMRAELAGSGVPAVLLPAATETRLTLALVDDDTTNINEAGTDPGAATWQAIAEAVRSHLKPRDVLVVSGSLPAGTDPERVLDLLRIARELGASAIADLPGALLGAAIAAGATHVKPNRHELADATGIDEPLAAARALAARGAAVLASRDIEGLLLVTGEGATAGRLDQPLAGNTTGAGDAAVAALAAALALGERDPAAVVRRCVAWSAAAVLQPLAGSIGDPSPLAPHIRTHTLEA